MDCPKCGGAMRQREYNDDIKIHRCDVCAGLWCKPHALAKMKREWMAEAVLDVGDPSIGRKLNDIADIDCPEGHGKLDKTYDSEQTHIWFEACSNCGGVYLDAGEFTDLKFHTLMDRVRSFVKGKRVP